MLPQLEEQLIRMMAKDNEDTQLILSKKIGITPRTLRNKLRKYGLWHRREKRIKDLGEKKRRTQGYYEMLRKYPR